jgi:CubicO group peptidase (beta-lactamase class C family)
MEVVYLKGSLWIPLCLLLLFVPVCSVTPVSQGENNVNEPDYWPTDGWRTSAPEAQGMDSLVLDQLDTKLNAYELCYNSFIVVRHGYIVFETYPNPVYNQDRLHFLASVTKSVTAGLFGIAVDQGYIGSIHDSVLGYFPNRSIANPHPWKDMLTVRDLLTMKTGLQWDEGTYSYDDPRNSFVQWFASEDRVQFMLDLPMAYPPNQRWFYNTGASSMLTTLINLTTGETPLDFAVEQLFQPLGITRYFWEADSEGINYGGFGMNLLPRDMAKYGFLYLHNGRWDEQQVISADWVIESTSPHTVFNIGYGYGYHWITIPSFNGYAAFGAGGQGIFVIPQHDLVIIITAEEPNGVPFVPLILTYVLPSLLDAGFTPDIQWKIGGILMPTIGIAFSLAYAYWIRRTQRTTLADSEKVHESS